MTSTALSTVALGLQAPWKVAEVAFDPQAGRIDFGVGFAAGSRFVCPHCGAEHQPVHDTQEREWRHLNVFPYPAHLRAKVPRVRGAACGKTAQEVRHVCIDLSARSRAGIAETLPWADVTFDEFHVIQRVNQAVDEVRRQEAKSTPELKRTRYLWLKDKHAWTGRQIVQFADRRQLNLQTHRAFQIKEALREIFRTASSTAAAEPLLDGWYSWARRCRLEPMKQVAKTLKDHWTGILNAFDSKLTNGRVEAINSLIQAAKAKARGYGTVKHLITISYLVAGKLTHLPASPFNLKACAIRAA